MYLLIYIFTYFTMKKKKKKGNPRNRRNLVQTITDADYKSLLHGLEQAAGGISLRLNADKTEFICFNQRGDISVLNGISLKLVEKFTYLGSSISSTENNINTRLAKAWAAIDDRLSIIWKSGLSDKIKHNFFPCSVRVDSTIRMHHIDAD